MKNPSPSRISKIPAIGMSAVVSLAGQSFAADTGKEADTLLFEEIVVTANRREQKLQDIPQSITAISADKLELMGADEFMDYAASVPGVSFSSVAPGQTTITMRGISSSQGVATVGIYQDETPITSKEGFGNNQPSMKLFDSERIEILRGPQGTLYGESSLGGTIRVITKQPDTQEFAAKLDTTISSIDSGGAGYMQNAMVNLPIIEDELAVRLVGYYRDVDGWIDNTVINEKDTNDEETSGIRATALWKPNTDLSFTLSHSRQNMDLGDKNVVTSTSRDSNYLATSPSENELEISSLVIRYDLGWADFMSSSSLYKKNDLYFTSVDQGLIDIIEDAFFGPGAGTLDILISGHADIKEKYEVFTQELRLVSSHEGPLQWTAGIYYNDVDIQSHIVFGYDLNPTPPIPLPPLPGVIALIDSDSSGNKTQHAVYGEFNYKLTDAWDFTFGARWFEEDSTISNITGPMLSNFFTGGDITTADDKIDDVLTKATITYTPANNSLLYFTRAEGFRSGGFNLSVVNVEPDAPAAFDHDTTVNYELGGKFSFLDGHMNAAFALFHIDWTDVQVVVNPTFPNVIAYTDNLGAAHSRGVELEVDYYLNDQLNIGFGGSWTEAESDIAVPAQGVNKGDKLTNVPGKTAYLTAHYSFPISDQYSGYLRGHYNYVDERTSTIGLTPNRVLPSYASLNLKAGIEADGWYGSLFINNATNEHIIFADVAGGSVSNINLFEGTPRTIGANFGIEF